jgi:hypothetical protein
VAGWPVKVEDWLDAYVRERYSDAGYPGVRPGVAFSAGGQGGGETADGIVRAGDARGSAAWRAVREAWRLLEQRL